MILLVAVPVLPLVAALLCLGVRRSIAGWLAALATGVSALLLLSLSGHQLEFEWNWLTVGTLSFNVGLTLDGLSWTVALLAACVAMAVNICSISYMQDDEDQARFFAWMSFFAGGMLTLVLANSLLLMFAAWESVGLASWALIGFWHRKQEAQRAARKAFLMTRLGDFGFLLAWLSVALSLGTTGIQEFLNAIAERTFDPDSLTVLAILFLIAAVGKSAQLPLSAWLPDAMAGPSPVSALIHSATMVAAGIYLILRLYPLFDASQIALTAMLWIGATTALVAALAATAQGDLKRVLAWSTISQLGEMMMALGLAGPVAATAHLLAHATYKSGLFLSAGLVQHATGTRELRRLGGLGRQMPVVAGLFGLCALALAGFPPLSAYWSEERILAGALSKSPVWALVLVALVLLAGIYIGRAAVAVFGQWRGSPLPKAHKSGLLTLAPIGFLALGAVFGGIVLAGAIEHVLPFDPHAGEVGLPWKLAMIGASIAGLGFGGWRAMRCGPVPAVGTFPILLEKGVDAVAAFGRAVTATAEGVRHPERGFDFLGRLAATAASSLSTAATLSEKAFDAGARLTGRATELAADGTETAETGGFADGGDGLAALLSKAGSGLRTVQTGKVYLYSLNLFWWVLIAGSVLVWISL